MDVMNYRIYANRMHPPHAARMESFTLYSISDDFAWQVRCPIRTTFSASPYRILPWPLARLLRTGQDPEKNASSVLL
jgi:hypothetical protein